MSNTRIKEVVNPIGNITENEVCNQLPYFPMQVRSNGSAFGLILSVSTLLIGTTVFLHHWMQIPYGNLTRDPTAVAGYPIYTGFLSQIGIFLWSATASAILSCVAFHPKTKNSLKFHRFLAVSGMLTILLGLDDMFLLHESFFPYIGIPENVIFACYLAFILLYLIRYFHVILETDYTVLGMALVFFGLSIVLDIVNPQFLEAYIFEDGAKLIGILSWMVYFLRTGFFRRNLPSQGAPGNFSGIYGTGASTGTTKWSQQ